MRRSSGLREPPARCWPRSSRLGRVPGPVRWETPACPDCQALNPPENKFCHECGRSLAADPPAEQFTSPRAYTPAHLAQKILTSRTALEGERKQVTVLFVDVFGFTSLSERLDPEEVHQLMTHVFQLMLTEVHRVEGTVNQFLGDGIMALFGAPIAHEDHGWRAVHAAGGILPVIADRRTKRAAKPSVDSRHGLRSTLEVNDPTTVLYTLTTLAQSCAALAAFVGAVGVFRLQMLRDDRNTAERDLRGLAGQTGMFGREEAFWVSTERIVQCVDDARKNLKDNHTNKDAILATGRALDSWRAFVPRQDRTRRTLLVLEAWNLGVIAASLIGFNYVPALAVAPWLSFALWVVAVVTALVPLACVFVWTQGVER